MGVSPSVLDPAKPSTSPRGRLLAVLYAAGVVAFPMIAAAQTAPAFPDLLRQAQSTAPRLAVSAAEVRAAEGNAAQASARPNPTLDLQVENIGGERPYRDFSGSETTLSVQQPLELGGKRAARASAAQADLAAARARRAQADLDFAYDLALAYAAAEASELRRQIAADAVDLARSDARAARLLVDNGKEAELRAMQAQAALAGAQAELSMAQAETNTALARLSVLAGTPEPYAKVTGGLLDHAATPNPRAIDAASPAVAAARADLAAANRRIDVERSRRVPDLAVSVGVRRLELDNATAAVVGLSAPLPLFDRNRGAVAAATANAQAAQARLSMAQAEFSAERQGASGQASAAQSALNAASEGDRASAEAYRLARIGYEAGRLPLSELLTARRGLIEARTRVVDAKIARLKAYANLARTQGQAPFGETP